MDPLEQGEGKASQYGVLKLQPQSPVDSTSTAGHFSFSNPVYEPTATTGTTTYKVEDVVVSMASGGSSTYRRPSSGLAWSSVQKGMKMRWEVAKNIWPSMLAIAMTYLVTLSLYPGIESEIISCKFGTWMPVILMAVFNASDLMGKMFASWVYNWSRLRLCLVGAARVVFIPGLLMCAWPREKPILMAEGNAVFFSIALGLTNGIIGSVPMIQAPARVSEQHRELTGNIMTLSYNVGLTVGSLVAYVFEALLGPPLVDPCGFRNIQTLPHNSSYFTLASTQGPVSTAAAATTTLLTTLGSTTTAAPVETTTEVATTLISIITTASGANATTAA